MNSLIADMSQIMLFCEHVVPPLKASEVFFISLSARNKYLTKKEREFYGLGRTEMFARRVIRQSSADEVIRQLRMYEATLPYYYTKKGYPMPEHSIIVYWNVNPSDMVKATNNFSKVTNDLYTSVASSVMDSRTVSPEGHEYFAEEFKKMPSKFTNEIQKARGTRWWVDVDFDINSSTDDSYVNDFEFDLRSQSVAYIRIKTHGGWHVLLYIPSINYDFHRTVHDLDKTALPEEEIQINPNAMIPIPGTYQGSVPVEIERIEYPVDSEGKIIPFFMEQ